MSDDPGEALLLKAPKGARFDVSVEVEGAGPHRPRRRLTVKGPGPDGRRRTLAQAFEDTSQQAWLDFAEATARAFGTRLPAAREPHAPAVEEAPLRAVLVEPISPLAPYGYGDPAVIRVAGKDGRPSWRLVATSNDAPDAFPILASDDLETWRLTGFVFPSGRTPAWALTGERAADFWAPEMHRVGEEYWLCFAARAEDRSLCIGLSRSSTPDGPFDAPETPLLAGGVIDPHIVLGADGTPFLIWKDDDNGVWPRRLADLLSRRGELIADLFPATEDQRTAALAAALWPWGQTLEPMEQFFLLQPLIEAASAEFHGFGARLDGLLADPDLAQDAAEIGRALTTRIWGQALAPDGGSLVGEKTLVLQNDQPWEAHLIEGAWVTEHAGRCYLFYAGNFSTHRYAIGGAMADAPLGPYRKLDAPLLRSSVAWTGPGHPSVTLGPDGRHRMFLHAYLPGRTGYGVFRALLTAGVSFDGDRVTLIPA